MQTIDVGSSNSKGLMDVMAVGPPGSPYFLFNSGAWARSIWLQS